ncbi:ABC transporter permease [Micromonosporaceae bacterium B7E4]
MSAGLARGSVELKSFFRERDAVVFTFSMPVVLLVLLGSIFDGTYPGTDVTATQYLVPSMMAAGVASTTFVNLGIGIAADRHDGTLKRLRGMPMPLSAYFFGKVILVLVASVAEVAALLAAGVLLFGVEVPHTPARWLTFAWVFLLGAVSCAFIGIAASGLARSARSAGAVMNLPYLVLSFVSGVFVTPLGAIPEPLLQIGSVFPLRWMAQGFRSAFLPDTILGEEPVQSWEHGRMAAILAVWCIGGLVLCLATFRWRGRRDG